ncbi:unnamed protein product [Gemmata massiliana]|uniref:Uncharacterized protein n=1 Tax=Gemmata massiliana TaxID=1210884 RepID=A0A6P2D729_9BACT|nr:hypothetical protein [Gemmata massiliana]VTR95282.1 unnamed protein product [Gemmata massiliana]
MIAQITSTVLYVGLAASVMFQVATVVRLAARNVQKRTANEAKVQPAARSVQTTSLARPTVAKTASRVRRRDYRVALRAAKASVSA